MAAPTRTRTRKTASTDPAAEPVEVAPPSRRVPSPRAATARRPATSSRTLRPLPPLLAEVEPRDPVPPPPPSAATRPPTAPQAARPAVAESRTESQAQPAAPPPSTLPAEPVAAAPPPPSTLPAESVAAALPPPAASAPAADATPPKVAAPPGSELTGLVELLQADVRSLQGLVTDHTEQTAQELGKTTMQMVRMVTGMAHHLDQLVEHVRQVTAMAQTLAQALTRVESTVAVVNEQTRAQLTQLAHGQTQLHDELAPILGEVVGLRAQQARSLTLERLEQYRSAVELKQLRQALEQLGATPAQVRATVRASRPGGPKR